MMTFNLDEICAASNYCITDLILLFAPVLSLCVLVKIEVLTSYYMADFVPVQIPLLFSISGICDFLSWSQGTVLGRHWVDTDSDIFMGHCIIVG